MPDDLTARPDEPGRAVVTSEPDPPAEPRTREEIAEANKRAGIAKRRETVRCTMVGATRGVTKPKTIKSKTANSRTTKLKTMGLPPSRSRRRGPVTQQQLVLRLSGVIADQLDVIDRITANPDDPRRGDTERHARTVAALSRVLTELRKAQGSDEDRADDDDRPRDLDDLRGRLSRRLDARLRG